MKMCNFFIVEDFKKNKCIVKVYLAIKMYVYDDNGGLGFS